MRPDASTSSRFPWIAVLFLVPAAHPLLIPWVGVPSHLVWWVHVLPVALLTYRHGRSTAIAAVATSAALLAAGEHLFGQGYGQAADIETTIALSFALLFTNLLVAGFALYARTMTGRYRVLFDEVRMGVVRLDTKGRIRRANPAAAAILGWAAVDDLAGRKLEDVLSIGGIADVHDLEEAGGWTGEVEVHAPSGSRRMHALLAVTHDVETGGHQMLMADRSMEVLQEQELERQAKLASLGEALAGVAHELNNPLATILAHAELAELAPMGADETKESFAVIAQQAVRMRDLVRELLGFSRKTEDSSSLELSPLIRRILRVQQVAVGRDVELRADLAWEGCVRASATKVEQILLNLISNAAYAVRTGSGSGVTVAVTRDGDWVDVEVRDDGPGIAEEIQRRLFQPFATTKPDGEGTGLGLAISRRLARSWGGDLTASNVAPTGASFVLRLPLAAPAGRTVEHPGRPDGTTASPVAFVGRGPTKEQRRQG